LPVVLDDVLVNFDSSRAAAAVRAVQTYAAQGGQIVVFTCHQHIREAFVEQGVPVRTLPNWEATGAAAEPAGTSAADPPRMVDGSSIPIPSVPARAGKRRRRRRRRTLSALPAATLPAASALAPPVANAPTIPFPKAAADTPAAPTRASQPIHFVDYDVA
jgi:hypothetical protein